MLPIEVFQCTALYAKMLCVSVVADDSDVAFDWDIGTVEPFQCDRFAFSFFHISYCAQFLAYIGLNWRHEKEQSCFIQLTPSVYSIIQDALDTFCCSMHCYRDVHPITRDFTCGVDGDEL